MDIEATRPKIERVFYRLHCLMYIVSLYLFRRFCVMAPDYISTTETSGDETQPPKTKEHLALQRAKEMEETHKQEGKPLSRPSTIERERKPKSRPSTVEKTGEERPKSRPSTVDRKEKEHVTPTNTSSQQQQKTEEESSKPRPSTVEKREESDTPYVTIKEGTVEKRGKIVSITKTKFVPQSLTLHTGDSLVFQLHHEAEHLLEHKVEQVFLSGTDATTVYPVTGGFQSGDKIQTTQKWMQEFNCTNEYFFRFAEHPPFRVVVKPKPVVDVVVKDDGFSKSHVCVYKGDNVRWTWSGCTLQHSIEKVEYCLKHAGYTPVTSEKATANPSKTGSHIETFDTPGVYYFTTQQKRGQNADNDETSIKCDTCVIQVLKKKEEHLIELKEDFANNFYECDAGERVWVQWRTHSTKTPKTPLTHSTAIKRICATKNNNKHFVEEDDVIVRNANQSTPSGVMSYVFRDSGVYEVFDQETPSKKCVVLVKPVKQQHEVRITKAAFLPGNLLTQPDTRRHFNVLTSFQRPSNVMCRLGSQYTMFLTFSFDV